MFKKLLSPGLVVLLVVGFFVWLHEHDKSIALQALSEAQHDSVVNAREELAMAIMARDSVQRIRDSVEVERVKEVKELRDSLKQRNDRLAVLGRRAGELTDSLRGFLDAGATLPTGLVGRTVDALVNERDECLDGLSECARLDSLRQGQITSRDSTIVAKDSTIAEVEQSATQLTNLYEQALKRSNPSVFKKIEWALPWVAVLTALGTWIISLLGG